MPSSTTALINNAGRLGALDNDSVANLVGGAQLGLGVNLPQIDAATPLVLPPVVPVVTHSPGMFSSVPRMDSVLKALIERHAKEISGIDFGYTLEGASTPAGHDGQELFMPTNAKRTTVSPSFTFTEVYGNLVWNFFRNWIMMIKHPDTQASMLSAINDDAALSPQLMSFISMDILFIQFDVTMRPENIIDAYYITNMWPQETGMLGAKRTIGQSDTPERSIPFYGIVQHNKNTKRVGQIIAEALGLHRVNYELSTPVANSISSRLQKEGIQKEALESLRTFQQV